MPPARPPVETGLAQLIQRPGRWVGGRRFALISNAAATAPDGRPGYEVLGSLLKDQVRSVFVGEHGLEAAAPAGAPVADSRLPGGPPIWSLYQDGRRSPDPAMLAEVDLLVLDLQDIGVRYYTYTATMLACLQSAASAGIPLMVLDRPNPLGGLIVEGPGIVSGFESFVGALDVPVRHGLTLGELARLAAARLGLPPEALEVVPLAGWDRAAGWAATGLPWLPPSPAARSLNMVRLYAALCLLEGTNLSEGRGTPLPFEVAGAPWLDGSALARQLVAARDAWQAQIAGPRGAGWPVSTPVSFVPRDGKHAGRTCHGVRLDAPSAGASLAAGVGLLAAARSQDPAAFGLRDPTDHNTATPHYHLDLLAGGAWLRESLVAGIQPADMMAAWRQAELAHRHAAAAQLLYGDPAEWLSHGEPGDPATPTPPRRLVLDCATSHQLAGAVIDSAFQAVSAVRRAQDGLAAAIDAVAERLAGGGRLIYVGAGTSGRLGTLDASECEPTFGSRPGQVVAIIAGGAGAAAKAREDGEDDRAAAVADLAAIGLGAADAVVGVAASGRTPYTVAALREARSRGALAIAVAPDATCPLARAADLVVSACAGPEPLQGSTRLGAGTAQKVILNAISTGAFARLGHVYDDQMVGVQLANNKLIGRAIGIVSRISGHSPVAARAALDAALGHDRRLAVRIAILTLRLGIDTAAAGQLLNKSGESLRAALRRGLSDFDVADCEGGPRQ